MRFIPPDVYRYMTEDLDSGRLKYNDLDEDWQYRMDAIGYTPPPLKLSEPEPLPDLFVDSKPALTPRSTNLEMEIAAGRMNPEFARKHPTIAKGVTGVGNLLAKIFENPWVERSGATGAEVRTMSDMPDKPTTGSTFGDVTADLVGSVMGFVGNPAGAAGRMPSIGANIWRGAEGVAEKVIPKLPGFAKLPDKIGRGAEYAGRIGGATVAFEGGRALANEREFDPLEMGLAAGANIGIDLATRGLLKGLSRRGTKTMAPEKDPGGFDFLQDVEYIPPDRLALPPGRQPTDFTVDPYGNTHIGEPKAELPASAERLALPGNVARGAFPPYEQPKALYPGVDWVFGEGYPAEGRWFVDPHGVVKDVPEPTLALPESRGKGITKYMLQDEGQTPWSDIGKNVASNATHKLSKTPFTDVYQELQPRVTEQTIPPAESTKALTNYIHDYFKGEISKNEIRRMSYDNMLDMAESIAKGRKSDLWDTMRTEGEKAGYDVDLRYRLETDPEYRAEWERLREVSGLADEPIRFKKGVPEKVEADVTDTPEFRKWFGDSKVVDEQGKPLVVYHGTNKDFSAFSGDSAGDKTGNPTAGWGFFFSHRPAEASRYATDWIKEGGNVIPSYISIKKPYIMPYLEYRQFTHLDNLSEGQAGLDRLADLAQQRKKELIEQGYDGIYVMQGNYNGKHITDSVGEIVAFSPTQIKSVYNRGTWDPANPDIRFKQRDMTVQDYLDQIELQNAMTTRIGPFRIGKVGLAPEALEKPDFQAANDIAEKLGLRLVPFKGTRNRGMQQGRTIYLNKDMKDPLDYVFWHETAHTMETTHEEHYGKLMDIAFEHVKDVEGMQKHYERFRYDKEEVPHEFAADVFAEALSTPGFFARVAEKAPELLKPLLEAIDSLVERVKGMISKNDTVVPYLKNLEALRERVRQEVAMPYFKDATGETQFMERFGDQWQGPAAKAKGERTDIGTDYVLDRVEYDADYDLYPGYGRDAIPDAEYRFESKQEAEQYARDVLDIFESLPEKVKVYRAIRTENPQTIDLEGLGESWSFDKDSAIEFGSHNGSNFLIESEVAKKDIDLQGSIDAFVHNSEVFGDISSENEIVIPYGTKLAEATVYQLGKSGVRENPILRATNVRAKFNRGTWDPANPDIRFKLGEQGPSPIDDLKAMVEYGASQLHKGGYEHFTKLLQKQFPEVFEGYSPEINDKLMAGVWFRAKELRNAGSTQVKLGDQVVNLGKGAEVASEVEPVKTLDEARLKEIDKEIKSLQSRIQGTRKSKTKYPTSEAKQAHINELQAEIDRLTKEREAASGTLLGGLGINPSELKDIGGYRLGLQDIWRNMRDVFGGKFEAVKERVLDPLEDAKAAWVDHQRALTDDLYTNVVEGLGIKKNSRESELVQLYGEGGYRHWETMPKGITKQKWLERLEAKHGAGNVTLTEDGAEITKPFTREDLVREVGEERAKDIIKAEQWFRQRYDQLLDQVNATRAQIYPGQQDKLVPKRKDYFRHFREMEGLEGVQNLFDTSAQIAPELAGKSMYTRPKSKFHGFMQQRKLGQYKPDAVGGFLEYLPSATYAIHIDPQGAAFRQLEKELVDVMGDKPGINKFLEYLKYYADDLQGKTNFFDRSFQALTSRKVFKGLVQLNNRIKTNVILGNAGTMLAQLGNTPQGLSFAKQHSQPGLTRYIASAVERARDPEGFAANNPMAQSRFLKERYSADMYRRFDTKAMEKVKDVAVIGMEATDRVATEFMWNACYEKAINTKGIGDPIRYADSHTRRLVAGRGIGEVPLLQKAKVFQLFAPFQVEVGNFLNVVRDNAVDKDWAGLFVILPTTLFLFNKVAEHTRGSGVTIDPVQAIVDGIKIAQDDKDNKAYRIMGRMAGEVFSNMPAGQTVAAMAFDDVASKKFFGREDPTRYGASMLVAKGIFDPVYHILPPFGGLQAKKTLRGKEMLEKEGSYTKDESLRYPISTDPVNAAKGLVFGAGGFKETNDYYENEGRPLSKKQTEQYEKMVKSGMNREKAYNKIIYKRKVDSLQSQISDIRKDKGLTAEEKRSKLGPLQQKLRDLRTGA